MPDPIQINSTEDSSSLNSMIAIAVGNTRSRVGVLVGKECVKAQSFSTDTPAEIASYVSALFEEYDFPGEEPVIFMSTVSRSASVAIEEVIQERYGWTIHLLGRDVQIPIRHSLTESGEETVGQDRLLCAIGAFDVVKQACVVVDMGTAITVDFVDGEGVYHGGAIMPGVKMMLDSLSDGTAHLPQLKYKKMDPSSFEPGKQTDDAILLGVSAAVRGSIRYLAERYAQFYEGYPQIIATGGDMGMLEDEELIEAFVPELQLNGIRVACKMILEEEDDIDSYSDEELGGLE